AQVRQRRFGGDSLDLPEAALSHVRLVEPGPGLFRQDARDALAVEINPPIAGTVEAFGQVYETRSVELAHLFLDDRLAVLELDRWQRLLEIGGVWHAVANDHALCVVAHVARLRDRANERRETRAALVDELVRDRDRLAIIEIGVLELGGA